MCAEALGPHDGGCGQSEEIRWRGGFGIAIPRSILGRSYVVIAPKICTLLIYHSSKVPLWCVTESISSKEPGISKTQHIHDTEL